MKKIIIICIILLLFLGYTPYHELNDLAVVDVMALEFKDDKYTLYLNVINDKNKVYTIKGNSLGEVFFKAKDINNKKTYYKHLNVVIFNKDILKNNNKLLTFFKDEFTGIDYLTLATDSNLNTLFNKYHKGKDYRSFLVKEKSETGSIVNISFKDLLSSNLDEIKNYVIPIIGVDSKLFSKGIYIIDKDYILDKDLARIVYLLDNKITTYSEKIKVKNNYYQVIIYNLNTSISYKNNTINISVTGNIDSSDTNNLVNIKKKIINDLEEKTNELVTLEKQKGFYVSNIINYIYLKEKDNSVNSYQNANIKIKVKLEEKERNNYD